MAERRTANLIGTGVDHDEEQDTPEARLQHYFGQAPDDASIGIYEIDPENRRNTSFLFSLPGSGLPPPAALFADILDRCGPGDYECLAHSGEGKIIFKQRFSVGSSRDRRQALIPDLRGRRAAAAEAAPPALPTELTTLLQRQSEMLELLTRRLDGEAQPRDRGPDIIEIARQLKELGLFGSNEPTRGMHELVKDFLSIRESLREESDGDSNPFAAALKHLAPAITNAVEKLSETRNEERAAAVARAQETAASQPAAPAANGYAKMLTDQLLPLVEMAERQEPPETAARWALETLSQQPDAIANVVIDFLDYEDSTQRLVGMEPRFAPHADWLEQVTNAIMQALDAQEQAAAAAAPAPASTGVAKPATEGDDGGARDTSA